MVEITVKHPTRASGPICITNLARVCRPTPYHDVELNSRRRVYLPCGINSSNRRKEFPQVDKHWGQHIKSSPTADSILKGPRDRPVSRSHRQVMSQALLQHQSKVVERSTTPTCSPLALYSVYRKTRADYTQNRAQKHETIDKSVHLKK